MIFGFLLTSLYVPGIAGAATTPRWALLAVGLPLMLWYHSSVRGGGKKHFHAGGSGAVSVTSPEDSAQIRQIKWGAGVATSPRTFRKLTWIHLWGSAFIFWSATSLLWAPNRLESFGELIKLLVLAQAFMLGTRISSLSPILIGMAIGLVISSIIAGAQLFWPSIVQYNTVYPAGLFINSGSLAEISALVLVGVLFYRSWWLAAGLLPSVALTVSRGAWLALGVAGIIWLWGKSKLSASAVMLLCAVVLAYSFHTSFHISSVVQRIGLWSDAATGLTWLGHGIGSFYTEFAYLSGTVDTFIERPEHLHNDWLEIAFELGAVGVVLVAAMGIIACAAGRRGSSASLLVLAGFAAESSVGFPLHVPCTAFLAALCLGHLARDRADIRDMLPLGRELLRLWHEWDWTGRGSHRGATSRGEPVPARAKI